VTRFTNAMFYFDGRICCRFGLDFGKLKAHI
jgi:hypothetical protein